MLRRFRFAAPVFLFHLSYQRTLAVTLPPSWPGLVPAIHVFHPRLRGIKKQDVDARDKGGHEES